MLFVLTENDAYLEKEGDVKGIASSCNELALFFMEQNNFEKTITYVDRTADLSKKLGSRELLAMAPMKLALGRW